jgi:DNA repair exonuclease SbcCD ATPase subunit
MAQSEKVIISVELRDKGVTTGTNKAKDSIDGLTAAQKRLKKAAEEATFQESEQGRKLANLQIKAQLAAKANKELAISTMNASKATKEGKTQTGLNNAILVEAGRAASDAQYGMQGMANNIGQLATLMGQHAQTQGGFVASFKELGKSLMGTGGVLIAIQLFISFLPKLEKLYKDLTDASNDFVQTLNSQQFLLQAVAKELSDQNTPLERRKELLESLRKSNSEVYDLLVKNGKEQKNSNEIMDKYLKLLANEEFINKKKVKLQEQVTENEEDLNGLKDKRKKIDGDLLEVQKQIQDLESEGVTTGRKIARLRGSEITQKKQLARVNEDILETSKSQIEISKEITEVEVENAKIRQELGIGGERDKAQFLEVDKSRKERREKTNEWFKQENKLVSDNFKIQGELQVKDVEDTRTALEKKLENAKYYASELEDIQETARKIGNLAIGFMDAEIQAEQAKTNKINNELRERLNNENLSAEERKRIQLKIASNDAALAKKQDKLKEKQFKIDKALAISQTLVKTYATAVDVMNDTPGGFFTRLSAAIPTIAFGLAQVAMIAKQKFVPSATSAPALDTGGGGAGGAAVQPPSFNIVGSSNINQLSDAISEAEKAPTRTYVVASDVSTAQELDRNIIESASL